jgi:hypothetical protein
MLEKILDCQTEIVNTIKLLIYKEDSSILEKINFDDDEIFLEPLLFTYFNYKNIGQFSSDNLNELIQGHYIGKTNDYKVMFYSNEQGIAYVPNIGYFDKNNISFFESRQLINETKIEVLKFKLSLLDFIFNNTSEGKSYLNEIIIDDFVYEKNIGFLTKALHLIKQNSLEHYKLIEQCCKKILLFKTNPENTNSFATINAHGIAFLNVYQDDYNVVFL